MKKKKEKKIKTKKNKAWKILLFIIIIIIAVYYIYYDTTTITTSYITISSDKIPDDFSGYKITQVSDLHNAQFGEDQCELLYEIMNTDPDIIVITGDIFDSRNTDLEPVEEFIEGAVEIAPVYYVMGNHESRLEDTYAELEEFMIEAGVTVLRNESVYLEENGSKIVLSGIDDPELLNPDYEEGLDEEIIEDEIESLDLDSSYYNILLSHRPETFDLYVENDIDLVFTGHTHGGQIRLPFIGALFVPNQGFFPEYSKGLYTEGTTNMIVNSGLGNSIIPFRIDDQPEIVSVTLN